MKNHTQKLIKSTQIVDMGIRSSVVMMTKYTKPVQIHRGENAVYKFMENMLEEVNWCKSKMKKYFNKPLKMTVEN